MVTGGIGRTLHLVVPGLLDPGEWTQELGAVSPALARLLARADRGDLGVTGADATLCELFGLAVKADADLPVAAITRLADGGEAESGWWLRADPVYLRADLRRVLLFDARILSIDKAEAQSLAAEFNEIFEADGWRLEPLHPCRWYLRLSADPGMRTQPLFDAMGQAVKLPWGKAAQRWLGLLTETQMLFFDSPVNRARELRGQLPINSIWLWGGGATPSVNGGPWEGIYGIDPLVRGLARLAGRAIGPLPASAVDWREGADEEVESLVVLEETRDGVVEKNPDDWNERVRGLDRDWLLPAWPCLRPTF